MICMIAYEYTVQSTYPAIKKPLTLTSKNTAFMNATKEINYIIPYVSASVYIIAYHIKLRYRYGNEFELE